MSQKSEVPDTDESRRQHVQQESAKEFLYPERHETFFVVVGGIAPAESDHAVGEGNEAMVRDRHTMSVLAQIAQGMLRAAKRAFRVNHPLGAEQRTKPGRERLRILQRGECSVEAEFVLRMQLFESIHELASEHFFEDIDGQEE